MIILIKLFVIGLCGIADRARGDDSLGLWTKGADAFVYGFFVAFLAFGFDLRIMFYFAVLFTAAMSIGYSVPWGAYSANREMTEGSGWHWWQFGRLQDGALLALLFRGLLGAVIIAPVCIAYRDYSALLAMVFAFPLACYLGRPLSKKLNVIEWDDLGEKRDKRLWNFNEVLRGLLMGSIAVLPI